MLETLISAETVQRRVGELARTLDGFNWDASPLLVGILKGSFHFLSDLGRAMKTDCEVDFMAASSYGGKKSSSGIVQIRKDLDINIEGRHVIIVEDIVDTGVTLSHLRELLCTRNPKSLHVVTLLSKRDARSVETPVELVGFEIPNEFVVGYGLDYDERFRNLPYIGILRED